jgi:hypothetical protein
MPGWEGTVAGVGNLAQARRKAWYLDGQQVPRLPVDGARPAQGLAVHRNRDSLPLRAGHAANGLALGCQQDAVALEAVDL